MRILNAIGKYLQSGRSWYQRATSGIRWITVHHTAGRETGTDDQILKAIMATHTKQGWPGLAYHFVILKNGNIYQINSLADVTWHDGSNWDSLGICLQGYFHSPYNEKPTDAQLKSLRYLLDVLCNAYPEFPAEEKNVLGHKERLATACPGDNLIGYVQDYRNKQGNVSWGNYSEPPVDPYKEKNQKLKISVDRLKGELDSDLSNPNANQKGIYDGTKAKIKKIYDTDSL